MLSAASLLGKDKFFFKYPDNRQISTLASRTIAKCCIRHAAEKDIQNKKNKSVHPFLHVFTLYLLTLLSDFQKGRIVLSNANALDVRDSILFLLVGVTHSCI